MHRRPALPVVLALALVGALLGGAPATPAGAEEGATRATPTPLVRLAEGPRYARRLLFDLHNDADPDPNRVAGIHLEYLIVREGRGVGPLIEQEQLRPEGRTAVVDDLFDAVLRRDADPTSRAFFVERLGRIGRQKVMADLLASAEHRATQGGGTDAGWIDALYRDALGRPADAAGRQYFLQQLQAGRTRGSIASFFTGGAEGRTALVRRLVVELLRRPADPASVQYYAGRLAAGTTVERVISLIAGSREYLLAGLESELPDVDVVLLHEGNRLEYWRLLVAEVEERLVDVTGLAEGEDLVAIDVRPATGGLYGVTDAGRVVAITPAGVATALGPPLSDLEPGVELGLDVDPVADEVVVTSGAGFHRVDPDTGEETPRIIQAYESGDRHARTTPTFSDLAHTGTTGYGVDAETDAVVTHDGEGRVTTIGPLHADVGPRVSVDIAPDAPHPAYAVLTVPRAGRSLWELDLATGEPRLISGLAPSVVGLAVVAAADVPSDEPAYGITPGATPELRRISTVSPTPTATWPVIGITAGTEVVGLDVQPSSGGLYGVGSNGQVYALAVPAGVGPAVATPLGSPLAPFVAADGVGFEIDPVTDVVRVVNGVRSYRVRSSDGAVIGDGTEPGTPGTMAPWEVEDPTPLVIVGSATTHAQRGAATPPDDGEGGVTRYHIELAHGGRLLQERPGHPLQVFGFAPGLLFPDGGSVVDDVVGFDTSASYRTTGYALLEVGGGQALVTIDLVTGEAHHVADLTETPQRVYSAFALA